MGDSQTTVKFTQDSFSGGMRRKVSPTRLDPDEYPFLSNGRVRDGRVHPVKLPLNLSDQLPSGNYQGLYGYGSYLLVFIDGKVYVRDYSLTINSFGLIVGFQLDSSVDNIYTEAVPSSWQNLQRLLVNNEVTDTEGDVVQADTAGKSTVKLNTDVSGNPACLVCQDGISQPIIIFPDGSYRTAQTFANWANTTDVNDSKREYVPVGKQMLYYDSILYVVSADGKEIYRSVTGRPLDFVVAIDRSGNKLPNLTLGKEEASRLSFKVDFNSITAIAAIPTTKTVENQNAGFYVGTSQASYIVTPNYQDTLFGEPKFSKQTLFPTGPINNFSLCDLLGDTALIDPAGIRSFNAVATLTNEGKNAPIYDHIYDFFEGITQVYPAAFTFDDYSMFSVDTIYGQGIVVRDNLTQKFVSLDVYPEVEGYIKQIREIKVNGLRKLFFITTGNQLFEMFGGTETATVRLYTREFSVVDDSEIELIPRRIKLTFEDVTESGTITVTEYVDRKAGAAKSKSITATNPAETPPIAIPNGASTVGTTKKRTFAIEQNTFQGDKVGVFITYDFEGALAKVQLVADAKQAVVGREEDGDVYATTNA